MSGVRRVRAPREAVLPAVRLRLLAPDGEQRPDDAVRPPRPDAARRAARDEPVEHRLDLIAGRVPGRAHAAALGGGIARVAQHRLGLDAVDADDLCAERVPAVLGVRVGLGAAEAVMHVHGA